jgi:hypothetical protein
MTRSPILTRALVAALATGAVAAPAAVARPIEDLPTKAAKPPVQDYRMPDTYDAATRAQQDLPAKAAKPVRDYRMPDSYDAATRAQQDLRNSARTSSLAGTTTPAAKPQPAGTDSDTPWAEIGIGLAGLAMAAGAAGVVTVTRRRSRVAA